MNNRFSYEYLRNIINLAKKNGYSFYTVGEFYHNKCPSQKAFVLRHDLDAKPFSLPPLLAVEKELGVRSTVYVRTTANDYNPFNYLNIPIFRQAEQDGFEIGLHSNFLEYAIIHNMDPMHILEFETNALRSFVKNKSIACHRDFSYAYNSLPWLEEHWGRVKDLLRYEYQAYDRQIMDNVIYINEGFNPHLCWRNRTPEESIATGQSICLMLHPHFWWDKHPFEAGT